VDDLVTASFWLAGYSSTNEVDSFQFLVSYDSNLLAFVSNSFYYGSSSGPEQQWLSKTPQESAADGYMLTNANNAMIPGRVYVAVGDLRFTYPERGTRVSSGFLISFQLRAIAPGSSTITVSPWGGSVLLDTSLRAFGTVQLLGAPILILPAGQLPTVTLTAPSEGAVFNTGVKITLTASASSPNGAITNVEFFAEGTNKLGQLTAPPYLFDWTNAASGAHTLTSRLVTKRS